MSACAAMHSFFSIHFYYLCAQPLYQAAVSNRREHNFNFKITLKLIMQQFKFAIEKQQ